MGRCLKEDMQVAQGPKEQKGREEWGEHLTQQEKGERMDVGAGKCTDTAGLLFFLFSV